MAGLDIALLIRSVSNCADVTSGAYMLVYGICHEIDAAKEDPVAVRALLDSLRTNISGLAMAVSDNTTAVPLVDRAAITKTELLAPTKRPSRAPKA